MKIVNGIAYAGIAVEMLEVIAVTPLEDMILLLTFNNQQERLYDATPLLDMPAFSPLRDVAVFSNPQIEDGVVTWMDGAIDVAPETMYQNSFPYNRIQVC